MCFWQVLDLGSTDTSKVMTILQELMSASRGDCNNSVKIMIFIMIGLAILIIIIIIICLEFFVGIWSLLVHDNAHDSVLIY